MRVGEHAYPRVGEHAYPQMGIFVENFELNA